MQLKAITLGLAIALGACGAVLNAPQVYAQQVVLDPSNLIQNILSAYRQSQSNINEVRQIQEQIRQYQNMLQNTRSLTPQQWQDARNLINQLSDVVKQGRAIAYSAKDLDRQFRDRFPGYSTKGNTQQQYADWSQTSLDSIRGALRAAGMQSEGLADEGAVLGRLRAAASGSTGQKQALDAANNIAVVQVEQTQKLRQLVMAQMQQQGAFMAAEQQRLARKDAQEYEMTRYRDPRKPLPKRDDK